MFCSHTCCQLIETLVKPETRCFAGRNSRYLWVACYTGVGKGHAYPSHLIIGTAGAGSLILEFGVLSRLTGDPRFEKAAYKAFFALWNRKSDIGLVGELYIYSPFQRIPLTTDKATQSIISQEYVSAYNPWRNNLDMT